MIPAAVPGENCRAPGRAPRAYVVRRDPQRARHENPSSSRGGARNSTGQAEAGRARAPPTPVPGRERDRSAMRGRRTRAPQPGTHRDPEGSHETTSAPTARGFRGEIAVASSVSRRSVIRGFSARLRPGSTYTEPGRSRPTVRLRARSDNPRGFEQAARSARARCRTRACDVSPSPPRAPLAHAPTRKRATAPRKSRCDHWTAP